MLFNLHTLMLTPCCGGGASVCDLVFNCAAAAFSSGELVAADMLIGTARKIVGFTNVHDRTGIVPDTVFTGLGGRLLSCGAIEVSLGDKEKLLVIAYEGADNRFPIVYLSSGSLLNAEKLAQKLAGTALVLCDKADILRNIYLD